MTKDRIENSGLHQFIKKYQPQIEKSLREHLPSAPPEIKSQFNAAVENALFSKEKHPHAVLTLLGAELFGGKRENILPAASAVEFIGASSSIFSDLADVEKDKTDKNNSLAAAIALLNASYGLVFVNHSGFPERAMQAHAEIVECVGAAGITGARSNDSVLIRLALRIGAILAGANYLELAQLSRFAELLGDNSRNSREDTKHILIENFPSSDARTCLMQLTESMPQRSLEV